VVLGDINAEGTGAEEAKAEGHTVGAVFWILSEAFCGAAFRAVNKPAVADDFCPAEFAGVEPAASKVIVTLRSRPDFLDGVFFLLHIFTLNEMKIFPNLMFR
jgi:hypothetical protein